LRDADRASEASSASLNLPGRNHVTDRKEDSKDEIVETLLMRKDSYRATDDDMEEEEQNVRSKAASGACRRTAAGGKTQPGKIHVIEVAQILP
jgi:hypothetical protein